MRQKRNTDYCIPAYDLLSLPSHIAQTRLPKGSTIHSELSGASSVINEENALQFCLQANLVKAFSQLRLPFSRQP